VAYLLKARIVEPKKQPLLGSDCATHNNGVNVGSGVFYEVHANSYVMQQQKNCWERCLLWGLCRCYITRTSYNYNRVMNEQSEEWDVGVRWLPACNVSAEQRIVHCWKTLPSSAVKTVTENTSLCVIVICKV
jgi:hypothetical protein